MSEELGSSLDAGIADLADLLGVELLPLLEVELGVEFANELGVDEVNEGVTHITLVLNKRIVTR